jgi:hypothetical protein
MANRYAVQTGNWSDTATWDGGTLPQAGDVVRPNGFVVTIDQDITVSELTNNASAPAVAGGSFTLNSSGITIIANLLAVRAAFNLINVSYGGGTSTIIADIGVLGLVTFANEEVSVTGQAGGRLVIIGNLIGHGTGFSGLFNSAVALEGSGNGFELDVTGIISGQGGGFGSGVGVGSGYQVIVDGIVVGSSAGFAGTLTSPGISLQGTSSTVIVNSYCVNGLIQPAIYGLGTSNNLILKGEIDCTGAANTVVTNTGTIVTLDGATIKNHLNRTALYCQIVVITPTLDVSERYAIDAVTNRFLYTAGLLTGYPPEAKVEDGEVFGPSGEFTGELSPVNVNTAQLATDLFDAIIASSDPLAVRLKNTATVSTVNDAVASLNVIP